MFSCVDAAAGGTSQSHHDVSRIILEWHHAEKIQQRLFISELTCWLLSSTITAVILFTIPFPKWEYHSPTCYIYIVPILGSTHEIANIVPFFVASSTSTKIRWKSGGLITLLLFPFARYYYIRINRQYIHVYTPPPGPKVLTSVYVCRCILFLIPLFPLLLLSNSKYIARSPQAFHQFDAICSHYRLFWSLH